MQQHRKSMKITHTHMFRSSEMEDITNSSRRILSKNWSLKYM